jgi:hypothetical protein
MHSEVSMRGHLVSVGRVAIVGISLVTVAAASTFCLLAPVVAAARSLPRGAAVRVVSPIVGGRPAPGYAVSRIRSGRCQPGQRLDEINLSFRCFTGNRVYETCLSAPAVGHGVVGCLYSPWTRRLTLIRARRLSNSAAGPITTAGAPWGIELAGGIRCTALIDVMHGYFHHRIINYQCGNSGTGIAGVLGGLDRATTPWSVEVVDIPPGTPRRGCRESFDGPPTCSKVRRIPVTTVLFAQDSPNEPSTLPFTGPVWGVPATVAIALSLILVGLTILGIGRSSRLQ